MLTEEICSNIYVELKGRIYTLTTARQTTGGMKGKMKQAF